MSASLWVRGSREDVGVRLKRRDRAAWEQLVSAEYAGLFNLHLRLSGDPDAAADLTQETFVAAYQGAPGFAERCRPRTWLYGVALNCNRNWWRRAQRHEPPEELADDLPDPEPTAEELAILRERADLVYSAVQRLPEAYRRTVALRYFAGLSGAEIAAGEGVDEGTIRWRLHQALRKLWVMLRPSLGEESGDEPGTDRRIHLAP